MLRPTRRLRTSSRYGPVLLLVLGMGSQVHAATIAEVELATWQRIPGYYGSGYSFQIVYLQYPTVVGWAPVIETKIFDSFTFSPSDSGSQVTLSDNSQDQQYDGFVDRLTNGADDQLIYWSGPNGSGPGTDYPESDFFAGELGAGAIDFGGYRIDSITLAIDSLQMDWSRVGDQCTGFRGCTTMTFSGRLLVEGVPAVVPIPTPVFLFGSALGLMGLMTRKAMRRVSTKPPPEGR